MVNWNALMQPVDIAGSVWQGFERGRKLRDEAELRKAITVAQGGDPRGLAVVMQLNPQLGMALEDQLHQRSERQREANFRGATADMMLSGGIGGVSNALAAPSHSPGATGGNPSGVVPNALLNPPAAAPTGPVPMASVPEQMDGAQASARERAIRANPEGFLTFEGKRLDVTSKDLKNYRDLNDMGMQLLGGVHDQPSYDAAKQRAAQLYSSYGQDASAFLSGLPTEYSPEVVESLRLQGMDTARQMQAIARENRLEWDIEDDLLDNERADRNTDSLVLDRRERRKDARNPSRPGSRSDGKPKSANALYADIMRRWTAGENLNGREREFVRAYEARQNKGGAGRRSRAQSGGGRVATAVGPNGQRIVVRNGKWVDAQTGKPVQ